VPKVVVADDHAPEQERVEAPRTDLRRHQDDEQQFEDCDAGEIAEVHRHRHRIAARLAERGCGDLDDPEDQRDLRYFPEHLVGGGIHSVISFQPGYATVTR